MQVRPSIIRQTLRALSKAPERLLSHEEMILLHYGWSSGIHADDCFDAMIRHNYAFIREVCKVIKHKEHFTDACQYCVEGLIRAIEKWEPERGLRFSTYAHPWLYQKLRRYQSNQFRTIRIAEHTLVKWHKLKRFYVILELELRRPPTDEELSERSGMSLETIEICRTASGIEPMSIETPVQGSQLVLGDTAIFGSTQSAEDEYFSESDGGTLMTALGALDDETRQMIALHLGLDGRVPQTIHMVASRYRIPPAVVKERIHKALAELRDTMKHLEDREQIALITWVRLMQSKHPELATIYHCPNGGYRDPRTAAKFKAMGVKPGVWDIFLPCPTPGLYVEMKAGKGRLTPGQVSFREALEPHGYRFVVAYSWHDAAKAIAEHVGFTFDV